MQDSLLNLVKDQFRLNINGVHGIGHWKRVEKIAIYLSTDQKVDKEVIRLFSILHDSRREDEHEDPLHGFCAAKYAWNLYQKKLLRITQYQAEQLVLACKDHSNPTAKSDNKTIQICWDSDRLDLCRLGIEPDPKYLYTDIAKQPETIYCMLRDSYACRRATKPCGYI